MSEEMLKELLANKAAMSAMPKETQDALKAQYDALVQDRERKEREERERRDKMSKEEKKEASKLRREREEYRKELLGLKIGDWTQNVPRNRRFVLAGTKEKKFDGCALKDVADYVPMDIVRGFTAPYFGYYQHIGIKGEARETLLGVINAPDEETFLTEVRRHFSFFHFPSSDYERNLQFSICDYRVDDDGNVTIVSTGTPKTFAEHFADLKKEFDK